MAIDAFVIRHAADGMTFRSDFLASADFDSNMLKTICQKYGLHSSGTRGQILDRIQRELFDSQVSRATFVELIIQRPKQWMALKIGHVAKRPILSDPKTLMVSEGTERWYGPVCIDSDPGAAWYLRPVFVPHWERAHGALFPEEYRIRWLCGARVTNNVVSLHWNGFSWAADQKLADHPVQFQYWSRIPTLFDEIEELTGANVKTPDLAQLVLHTLWDRYRYNDGWVDKSIRAQSGGVAVSAHAGAVSELDVGGLRGFAQTIRKNIEYELKHCFDVNLPEPERFDEVVLRTLIREYGARSYEFSLASKNGERMLRLNTYFGVVGDVPSPDALAHFHVYVTWRNDLDQLRFLLDNLELENHDASLPG
jgi:hypothetical protein